MIDKMNITEFLESLGAPVANIQWSWGAVSKDGAVFLRVFRDEIITNMKGERFAVLLTPDHYSSRNGTIERTEQLALVSSGAPCYVIVLTDGSNTPSRKITDYDETLLIGGDIVKQWGLTTIKITGTTTAAALREASK